MPVVERRGVKALQVRNKSNHRYKYKLKIFQIWCRRVTDSYENVNIIDMDSSWRDGLAFCALIHHFRPQLIEFSSLTGEDVLGNNTLAFKVAEEELGIPSLLDPEDMLDTDVPDKFSIITYVSQFYHLLKDEDNSRSPSLPVKEMKVAPASPQGTPESVPRSVFLSSNPILRNNKYCPTVKVTGDTVNAMCEELEKKANVSHGR